MDEVLPPQNVVYWDDTYGPHYGRYTFRPDGAFDTNVNQRTADQATETFMVKLGTRARVEGYRKGVYVYLRAYVSRYFPDRSAFAASSAAVVDFYGARTGLPYWYGGTSTTKVGGYTPYVKLYAPLARYFKVAVRETSWRWNADSPAIFL